MPLQRPVAARTALEADGELDSYRFEFPDELVAENPVSPRDSARLLVFDRATAKISHAVFRDLGSYLKAGDCVVVNDTKVMPCRLVGKKPGGGKAEVLLIREINPGLWSALGSGLKKGQALDFPADLKAEVAGLNSDGEFLLRFDRENIPGYLEREGLAPLPPYILSKRKRSARLGDADRKRYQTVYAVNSGSIAAPTAGLHFTPELLSNIGKSGICVCRLTLHVGRGTFKPVLDEDIRKHRMMEEPFSVKAEALALLRKVRGRGGRIVAVGTTATRTLESLEERLLSDEAAKDAAARTDLFIHPGFQFKVVSALVTNFHQPRSTPLMLAAAFVGRERLLGLYREAIRRRYRLFSYGDAMLIL